MPRLLKQGRIVPDPWRVAGADEPLSEQGRYIVPFARWQAEQASLRQRSGPLGVRLAVEDDPELLAPGLDALSLVALEFPGFRDGRAYTQARTLRERLGFRGEIRAVGEVLRDQLAFMSRCGFDTFEVDERIDGEVFARAHAEFSVHYQPATDGPGLARRGTFARP